MKDTMHVNILCRSQGDKWEFKRLKSFDLDDQSPLQFWFLEPWPPTSLCQSNVQSSLSVPKEERERERRERERAAFPQLQGVKSSLNLPRLGDSSGTSWSIHYDQLPLWVRVTGPTEPPGQS
jgi:hypothetical protein